MPRGLLLSYKKSFFDMVQPIDFIFCKIIEIIEQNFLNRAGFYLGLYFIFLAR